MQDVLGSKQSNLLAYSEVMGQVLCFHKDGRNGGAGHLLMYTDAVVATRNTYGAKKDAIKKFNLCMEFYTSLYKCTRYDLPVRTEFYTKYGTSNSGTSAVRDPI